MRGLKLNGKVISLMKKLSFIVILSLFLQSADTVTAEKPGLAARIGKNFEVLANR